MSSGMQWSGMATKRISPAETNSERRPRKIRRGTQSCWACKRRKVRCSFATGEQICDGCKIRNTTCISQEYPDDLGKVDGTSPLYERLAQVEAILERLSKKVDLSDGVEEEVETTQFNRSENPQPVLEKDSTAGQVPTPQRTPGVAATSGIATNQIVSEHYDICVRLLSAWPDETTFEALLEVSGEVLGVCHGTISGPVAEVRTKSSGLLEEIMRPPSFDSHPVLIGRKLLKLVTYLQTLSHGRRQKLDSWLIDHGAIRSFAFATTEKWVTSNDNLLGSVEGIDCLMLQGWCQIMGGHLRSAWHSNQRAMLKAQMMGLDRGKSSRPINALEPETLSQLDARYMWFRLMQTNRYLSLMLGMLQGTPNNSFAEEDVLNECSPLGRMYRQDCVISGHILQRNESALYDTATTLMIDQLLQKSGSWLDSSWWTVPDLISNPHDEMQMLENVIRVMDQLTHFHLITQLHLPHLLRPPTEHEWDYSKFVAVNASREVLIRFTSQNDDHSCTAWCRGISLLTLISCVAIYIVHIGYRHGGHDTMQVNDGVTSVLGTHRRNDQALMDRTLDCMDKIAFQSDDALSSKTAVILRRLLSIDAGRVVLERGGCDAPDEGGEDIGCQSRLNEWDGSLSIYIACLGTLRFYREVRFDSNQLS